MEIIAERDKTLGKILLIMSVILIGLSCWALTDSLWYIFALAIGILMLGIGVYGVFLLPKAAILRDGNTLLICYAFSKKQIELASIEYVSYNEVGEFHTRRGSLFGDLHVLKNDIRRLTVTVKQDGVLKHYTVFPVLFASAVATSINAMTEKEKKNKD